MYHALAPHGLDQRIHAQGALMSHDNEFTRAVNERLVKLAGSRPSPRENFFYQDQDGDFVQFFSCRDAHYAQYVDEQLTVYCRRDDEKIIGARLSHVSTLLDRAPGIRLEVRDGKVGLRVLFMASRWTAETKIEEANKVLYEKVRDIIERIDDDVLLECA